MGVAKGTPTGISICMYNACGMTGECDGPCNAGTGAEVAQLQQTVWGECCTGQGQC